MKLNTIFGFFLVSVYARADIDSIFVDQGVKNGTEWTGYMTFTIDLSGLNSTNLIVACKTKVYMCAVIFVYV
jgi:hypothetical protein